MSPTNSSPVWRSWLQPNPARTYLLIDTRPVVDGHVPYLVLFSTPTEDCIEQPGDGSQVTLDIDGHAVAVDASTLVD